MATAVFIRGFLSVFQGGIKADGAAKRSFRRPDGKKAVSGKDAFPCPTEKGRRKKTAGRLWEEGYRPGFPVRGFRYDDFVKSAVCKASRDGKGRGATQQADFLRGRQIW
ncbi:MAG: hypothetical protein DRH56_07310 [Deltaproteobacteria bacterium]|nr:MAG: hypothetical protein DRH56_07310 [Deltaproteobacteria bacterium]